MARTEAVHWILKVTSYYGFSALTPILAVNYLDRFLSTLDYKKDEPWMIQLAAVTCLSLAAKVEEIHVPLLLDFQVEDAKYVFEAKTIQRMELLVLSTLKWRMNPVTPLSFLDHIIRRLGLKNHLHWEFFRRCECLLLSLIPGNFCSSFSFPHRNTYKSCTFFLFAS
nr:cyclin-D3-1-like [Ipomoea batatas]